MELICGMNKEEFAAISYKSPGVLQCSLNGHFGGSLEDKNTKRNADKLRTTQEATERTKILLETGTHNVYPIF